MQDRDDLPVLAGQDDVSSPTGKLEYQDRFFGSALEMKLNYPVAPYKTKSGKSRSDKIFFHLEIKSRGVSRWFRFAGNEMDPGTGTVGTQKQDRSSCAFMEEYRQTAVLNGHHFVDPGVRKYRGELVHDHDEDVVFQRSVLLRHQEHLVHLGDHTNILKHGQRLVLKRYEHIRLRDLRT